MVSSLFTLYSLVQGEKGNKCFSPAVEAAVLKIIRKPKVWDCFEEIPGVNIGTRGCKVTGFWEKKKLLSVTTLPKVVEAFKVRLLEEKDVYTIAHLHKLISLLKEIYESSSSKMLKMKTRLEKAFKKRTLSESIDYVLQIYKHLCLTTLEERCCPSPERSLTFPYCDHFGLIFSKEFQVPLPRERKFLPFRNIGTLVDNPQVCKTVCMDDHCKEIYRGSIVDKCCTELHVFKPTYYFYQECVINELYEKGEAWNRTVEYRCDASILVALNRYFLKDKTNDPVVYVEVQDITDQYPNLLL